MTKEEHIQWWQAEANRPWHTATLLYRERDSVAALLFCHLTIEKLLKALWIRDNVENIPKRTHDLRSIYNETDVKLPNGWYDYLNTITGWNIEGRYPDYKLKIYEHATSEYKEHHYQKLCELKALLESAHSAN